MKIIPKWLSVSRFLRVYVVLFAGQFAWIALLGILELLVDTTYSVTDILGDKGVVVHLFLSPLLAAPAFSYIRYALKWSPGRRVTSAIIVACAAYFLPFVIAAIVQGTSVIYGIVASLILIGSGWTLLLSTGYFVLNDVAGKTSTPQSRRTI